MSEIFLRPKPVSVLINLKDSETSWYPSKLATASNSTFVYVHHLVSLLEKEGLVVTETKGKKRMVKLTERGLKVAMLLDNVKSELQKPKQPTQQ